MWQSLPDFGTGVLYAILVMAAYTFAVSIAAGRGQPRLLNAARTGAYATSATIALGVVLLSYAFVSHDFRLRYVARYSDRSMDTGYLLTALWGGQDGSLLWWSFLLSGYITACVLWLKGRHRELQPYVIATLMVIVSFFAILMLFAANPFATSISGGRPDGEGLNPLLQNYWMIIHPPALYMGFVGCSIPFAFAMAALITGRLDTDWIHAVRKWMLFAWLFLSFGNVLGMAWAYEELGWGGYWAWDPVENAACLPWFTATAYIHSTMIQERRNIFKVWNVFLISLTFFLTIFGTALTRSGLIASVHSFAQSSIGEFFVYGLGLLLAASAGLIVWRLPLLRSQAQIETVASREAMFVANNWALLGGMTFILIATIFPKISEALWQETVTVGPPFFNRWMAPIGLVIFVLMGVAPLFGWRKTSKVSLRKAFMLPLAAGVSAMILHLSLGKSLGFPAIVDNDQFYAGFVGVILQKLGAGLPLVVIGLAAFNVAVVVQEFARGVGARRAAAARRNETESVAVALIRLLDKNRRRYGGYIVHLGIVCMYVGFVGAAWTINREATLLPGGSATAGDYTLTYRGSRMEVDDGKRMVFADVDVQRAGQDLGRMSPAKFIYKRMPESPTTEVALRRGMRDDLYVVVGTVDPQSKRATFQFHVNPLVSWIWLGMLVLILGASVSLWPEVKLKEVSVWGYARAAVGATTVIMLSLLVAAAPAQGMLTRSARPPPGRDVPSAAAGTASAPATAEPAAGATEVHGR